MRAGHCMIWVLFIIGVANALDRIVVLIILLGPERRQMNGTDTQMPGNTGQAQELLLQPRVELDQAFGVW